MAKIWFKAKNYGWGWYPCTWQGWAIILLWLAWFAMHASKVREYFQTSNGMIYYFSQIIIMLALLLLVCWGTGEKPRWRWGN